LQFRNTVNLQKATTETAITIEPYLATTIES